MVLLLCLFAVGLLLELALHAPGLLWRLRKIIAICSLVLTAAATGGMVFLAPNLFTILIAWVSLYRLFNCLRIMQGRMHERYLQRSTLRTSLALAGLQVFTGLGWAAWTAWHTTGHATWTAIAIAQLAAALGSLLFTLRSIRRTSWPAKQAFYTDAQLPTISVAIPARNETDDLQACLQSILTSDYPKLEVLVLDDCSQGKRTPEIIRSFAHDGVRFVQGTEPEPTWLAKNYAYAALEREASGEYILFCGVDVRFARDSLRKLASLMLARNKLMVSVLPERVRSAYGTTSLIQAMRYWWELVPPRRLFQRPPVLSTCWIIRRNALKHAGGFRAVARAIVPEAYFARTMAKVDGYSFLRAGRGLGVESIKTVADQRDTAVRMRYPQVHKRPEQVVLHTFLETIFLLMPFTLVLGGFWLDIGLAAQLIALAATLCLVIIHELVVLSTKVNTWWFGLIAPPLMILADIVLLHFSMWKYEFSIVEWKGRNVCIPAMHVVPHLPKT